MWEAGEHLDEIDELRKRQFPKNMVMNYSQEFSGEIQLVPLYN